VGAEFSETLFYRGIDRRGELTARPGVAADVADLAGRVLAPLVSRKKVLFTCRDNTILSPMAAAFARSLAGGRLDVASAGWEQAGEPGPDTVRAMAEKGMDLAFQQSRPLAEVLAGFPPDLCVVLGGGAPGNLPPGVPAEEWTLDGPLDGGMEAAREARDAVERRVRDLVGRIV
jgi:protein-tyrosine-phosphatase